MNSKKIAEETRTCTICHIEKPLSEFRNRGGKMKHLKDCRCKRCFYDYINIRSKSEERKKSVKAWREKNREKTNGYARTSYHNNKIKQKARASVKRAIKANKMERLPCLFCGNKDSEGHHVDYKRPLYVLWMCRNCHAKVHRLERMYSTYAEERVRVALDDFTRFHHNPINSQKNKEIAELEKKLEEAEQRLRGLKGKV